MSEAEFQDLPVTVIHGGLVWSESSSLIAADVVIRGELITEVGPGLASTHPGAHQIDARNTLVLPGFVNAHTHSYTPLCRHDGSSLPLEPWMMYAWAATVGRTREEVKLTAQLQAIEALKTGTTALLDQLGGNVAEMDGALEAYEEIGIRAKLAPMISDIPLPQTVGIPDAYWPEDAGHLDAVFDQLSADELVEATLELDKSWHSESGRTGVMFGPSAPMRCSAELMTKVAMASREIGLRVHTHLLESRLQGAVRPPEGQTSWLIEMDRQGLLTPRLSTAHNLWITRRDIELAAERGVSFVHNPQSNLQLGSGVAELTAWRSAGVKIALGTDGVNCGGSMDMISSMRLAALLHRPGRRDPDTWESPASVLQLATQGGANLLGLNSGSIRPGALADISIFSLTQPVYASAEDPVASLILGSWDHAARTVIVNGATVVENGQLVMVDESAILARAAEARSTVLRRNANLVGYARAQEEILTSAAVSAPPNRELLPFGTI